MTDDPISLTPDPYHALAARDRDYLLAARVYALAEDAVPAASTVQETVGRITGDEPSHTGMYAALDRLEDAGYIERVAGEPHGSARGVRVTDDGRRVLERGAARLDAAASVEADHE